MLMATGLLIPKTQHMITELALRTGSPKKDSPSPYDGCYSTVCKQFEHYLQAYPEAPLAYFFDSEDDYDADRSGNHPNFETKNDDDADTSGSADYYEFSKYDYAYESDYTVDAGCYYPRRLEDIPTAYIVRYLQTVMHNISTYEKSGWKAYKRQHPLSEWVDGYEDDDGINETELIAIASDTTDKENIQAARKQLAYAARRLHDLSKIQNIHVISGIIAYELASRGSGAVTKVKILSVSNHPVLEMSKDGYPLGALGNENIRKQSVSWLLDWLHTMDGVAYMEYEADRKLFLSCLNRLSIALEDIDVTIFDEEYINNKLVVTYLASNQEYVGRRKRSFNTDVYKALSSIKLDDYFNVNVNNRQLRLCEVVECTANAFIQSSLNTQHMGFDELEHPIQQLLINQWRESLQKYNQLVAVGKASRSLPHINLSAPKFKKTFLCDDDGYIVVFDMRGVMNEDAAPLCWKGYAMLNTNGVFVGLSSMGQFIYQDILLINDFMAAYLAESTNRRFDNCKFGKWKN